jgi:hypothetical protein
MPVPTSWKPQIARQVAVSVGVNVTRPPVGADTSYFATYEAGSLSTPSAPRTQAVTRRSPVAPAARVQGTEVW